MRTLLLAVAVTLLAAAPAAADYRRVPGPKVDWFTLGGGKLFVAAGGSLLDPAVTSRVLDRIRNASRVEEAGAFTDLTDQERRVLAHLAEGCSNRQIADRMGLAEKTVRNYVSSILAKLALESRSQAATYAIRKRLPGADTGGS